MKQHEREELALQKLLQRATNPQPPEGSAQRLMARLQPLAPPQQSNVLSFKPRQAQERNRLVVLGMSLAAALLLGVLIGSANSVDTLLPGQAQSADAGQSLDLGSPLQIELIDEGEGGTA